MLGPSAIVALKFGLHNFPTNPMRKKVIRSLGLGVWNHVTCISDCGEGEAIINLNVASNLACNTDTNWIYIVMSCYEQNAFEYLQGGANISVKQTSAAWQCCAQLSMHKSLHVRAQAQL